MSMRVKTLSRTNWERVTKRKYARMDICDEQLNGQASLILIEDITAPLSKTYDGIPVTIVDRGYCWLQLAPKDKTYWLTVQIDDAENIVSYYFDITDHNVLESSGDSYFYDLYLDVVLLPNGRLFLLDEDELLEALQQGVITKAQFDMAYETARLLLNSLPGSLKELHEYCLWITKKLKQRLTEA